MWSVRGTHVDPQLARLQGRTLLVRELLWQHTVLEQPLLFAIGTASCVSMPSGQQCHRYQHRRGWDINCCGSHAMCCCTHIWLHGLPNIFCTAEAVATQ
jgi:hypothetical protein